MRLRTLVPTLLAAGLAVAGVQSCSPQPERAPSVREPKQSADAGSPPTAAADLSSLRTAQRAAPPPAGTEERAFADAPPGRRLERSRASGAGWAAPAGALAHQADADLPRLGAGEELWVVARADWDGAPPPASAPVYGGLEAMRGGDPVPLPLEHTDVQASIAGYIASVRVRQRYANPYGEKIEARYVFPLPQDAAVSDFVMTVGERHIRGIIRERQQAERIYAEARQQGYVTSLLTQERPNVFTQSVANIEPGTRIDVDLTYYNPLAYHDGDYEFVFPMVVGPRFNPPGSSGGIGAVPAGSGGASGQATEVQYLPPDRRSGHDIALQVDLDAGMAIEAVDSPTHAIDSTAPDSTRRRVTLRGADTVPNKDFVLRYRLAGGAVKTALLTHRDQRGGFFTLMVQPPADLAAAPRAPMELVVVLDCAGSMAGEPLAIAKRAAARALRRLGPDDTFQVIQFST
ncbi:MAG: VIT domain-containing protein, partial [Candidatus Binatia bacterium]